MKTKTTRRLLAFLLVLTMAMSLLPMTALAAPLPAPTLSDGIENTYNFDVIVGYENTIMLSKLFTNGTTYTVSINDAAPVAAEEMYSFTATVSDDYVLKFVANNATGSSPSVTFNISAYLVEEWYDDVVPNDWYYNSVGFVTNYGIMNGTDTYMFTPNGMMNRAMLVTILYRSIGEPEVTGQMPFTDVPTGKYYSDAVIWASQNNITNGTSVDRFSPNANVTREQLAKFFLTFATKYLETDTTARADLGDYTDASKISSWAKDAMQWANGLGIITGRTITTLVPDGTAKRAEVATMLMRLLTYNDDK